MSEGAHAAFATGRDSPPGESKGAPQHPCAPFIPAFWPCPSQREDFACPSSDPNPNCRKRRIGSNVIWGSPLPKGALTQLRICHNVRVISPRTSEQSGAHKFMLKAAKCRVCVGGGQENPLHGWGWLPSSTLITTHQKFCCQAPKLSHRHKRSSEPFLESHVNDYPFRPPIWGYLFLLTKILCQLGLEILISATALARNRSTSSRST